MPATADNVEQSPAPPSSSSSPSTQATEIRLRLYHQFEKPRNGRSILVPIAPSVPSSSSLDAVPSVLSAAPGVACASASVVHTAIASLFDHSRFTPHVFDGHAECFVPLPIHGVVQSHKPPTTQTDVRFRHIPRLDIRLYPIDTQTQSQSPTSSYVPPLSIAPTNDNAASAVATEPSKTSSAASSAAPLPSQLAPLAHTLLCNSSNTELTASWFAIGIARGKVQANHGSLWRSALQFGAAMTFTIGARYKRKTEGAADVYKTSRQVPCLAFQDCSAFIHAVPPDAALVAVEYGGTPLHSFVHPKRAMYVLGGEVAGVPPSLVAAARFHVSIPTAPGRPDSLNVAAAGAILLYDRFSKELREREKAEYAQPPSDEASKEDD